METRIFRTNLNCGSCIEKVTPFLNAEPEISEWKVDTKNKSKPLTVTGTLIHPDKVKEAVKKAGFEVYEEISQSKKTNEVKVEEKLSLKTYFPLLLIGAYLIGLIILTVIKNENNTWMNLMNMFMGGFFLIFSFFKILNLKGFAESYASYDVLAKRWYAYGYVYPFIELFLGVLYFVEALPLLTNALTVIVMAISSVGVVQSIRSKQKIQCACLGTMFNLPMSTITLIEDLLMLTMALAMLILLV